MTGDVLVHGVVGKSSLLALGDLALRIVEEASFHVLESIETGDIGEVESGDDARSLVAEQEALLTGQRCSHSRMRTALAMVTRARRAMLHRCRGLDRARVLLQVHRHQLKRLR